MTFVTVEGHQLAADQADRFLADRERVAREMTALLAPPVCPGVPAPP